MRPRHLPPDARLPALPPSVPRRRYPVLGRVGALVLKALGWTLVGGFADRPRQAMIAVPHTSNWDGIVGLAAVAAVGVEVHFFAKRELFWGPLGALLRRLGGIPVDRSAPGGMVGQAVARFAREDAFVLGATPEGTRRRVATWKTGFHRIAMGAGVPVAVTAFDWGRRQIGVRGAVELSGDVEADLRAFGDLLADVRGRHPERETPLPRSGDEGPDEPGRAPAPAVRQGR